MQKQPDHNPLVSVIIPTYNRAWIVEKAISSVLQQEFKDFELLIVDDGSTDETATLLASMPGNCQVIRQANRGVSAARNHGLRKASGSLIAFLDSDDSWLPRKLAVQVDFFRQNPQALVCQTEEIWIRNGKRVNPGQRHRKPSGMIFEKSLHLCLVSPSAVMMRKEVFAETGIFDERLPACEDYDLWLRISRRHPIHLIDEPLIIKRGGHADQLSRTAALDKYRIQSIAGLLACGSLTTAQHKAALDVLEAKTAIYAEGCRKRGRLEEARRCRSLVERFRQSE